MPKNSSNIFLILLVISAAINCVTGLAQGFNQLTDHRTLPIHHLGDNYIGLRKALHEPRALAYLTDKTLSDTLPSAQLGLAQYQMAPTVLVVNPPEATMAIVDATTVESAQNLLKQYHLTPISRKENIIIGINPQLLNTMP